MASTSAGSRHLLIFTAEHVADGYGSSTALRTLIDAVLGFSDWCLTVVAPEQDGGASAYPPARIHSVSIPIKGRAGRRAELLRYARASRSMLKSSVLRPDIVVSWQPLPTAFAGSLAAEALGVPHVVRTCGPELARSWSRFPNATSVLMPLTRRVLRRADAVIVKSEIEHRLLNGRATRNVHVIPNAVDHLRFAIPRSPGRGDVTRLLAVCQLESHKGVARLISAVAGLARRSPHRCELTIVGDGSQRRRLEHLASSLDVHSTFLGRLPHTAMPELYATHDALVLPSQLEGCSNAVLEAMASGLPIVGARSALSDLVEDGVSGVLADSHDETKLEDALGRFLAGTTRESMGDAARRRVATHTPERLFYAYRHLVDDLSRRNVGNIAFAPSRTRL